VKKEIQVARESMLMSPLQGNKQLTQEETTPFCGKSEPADALS